MSLDAEQEQAAPLPAPPGVRPESPLRLVVMVPCLDEAATIAGLLERIPEAIPGIGEVIKVVVDDGSTDATAALARAAGARIVSHGANLGLGRAFRSGVREALSLRADAVVNIDGDGQFDPADIPLLLQPILEGRAHMVTASRFLRADLVPRMPRIKRWGNRWVARIVRLLTGLRFHDVSCGFRSFSREALLRMNLFGGFTYTQETFLDLVFKGMTVVETPVRVRGTREFGRSRMASNLPRYAARSLQIMLRAFIAYRPFSFFAWLAAGFLGAGAGLLGFLLAHYLRAGSFSPHIWAGFVGGALALVGIITLVIGIVGDMMVQIRMNQEKILYFLKREAYDRWPAADPPAAGPGARAGVLPL